MKIVIAGAGEVGFHIIENLSKENLEISVIDTNADILEELKAEYDIKTDNANVVESKYLRESHLKDADMFLAITNSDETNMIACKMASEAGARETICRMKQVDSDSFEKQISLKSLGIDRIINPVLLVSDELFRLALAPNVVESHEFCDGEIKLIGFKAEEHLKIINKTVGGLEPELNKHSFGITAIRRKEMAIIPNKEEMILSGDIVYFICKVKDYESLLRFLGDKSRQKRSKRVFINGGGQIGLQLAQKLDRANQKVKVIEKDANRCLYIYEKLEKALVLNFDGVDLKQLLAEGIDNADYFISVTDSEEVNLCACLLANSQGVDQTICLLKQPELIQIVEQGAPISRAVSPRLLTGRYLTQFVQDSDISSYFSIINGQVEVLEIKLEDDAPCLNIPLKKLQLPDNVMIGIIKRGENYILPKGRYKLSAGDTVLALLHRFDRDRVRSFFRPRSSRL